MQKWPLWMQRLLFFTILSKSFENFLNNFIFKEHSYYERNDCIPRQIFGETCKSDEQCSNGLVCSSRGYLVNVCLGDLSKDK